MPVPSQVLPMNPLRSVAHTGTPIGVVHELTGRPSRDSPS